MRKPKRNPSIEPSHPGDVIALGLEESGIKRLALAQALGISRNTLYKLLERRQGVTAEMAVRLSEVWGGSPEMWMQIQAAHDLWHARKSVDTRMLRRLRDAA